MALLPRVLTAFSSPHPQPGAPHTASLEAEMARQAQLVAYAACGSVAHYVWPYTTQAPGLSFPDVETWSDFSNGSFGCFLPIYFTPGSYEIVANVTILIKQALQSRLRLVTYDMADITTVTNTGDASGISVPLAPKNTQTNSPNQRDRQRGASETNSQGWTGGLYTLTKTLRCKVSSYPVSRLMCVSPQYYFDYENSPTTDTGGSPVTSAFLVEAVVYTLPEPGVF